MAFPIRPLFTYIKRHLTISFWRGARVSALTLVLCVPPAIVSNWTAEVACDQTYEAISNDMKRHYPDIGIYRASNDEIYRVLKTMDCSAVAYNTTVEMTFMRLFPLIWFVLLMGSYVVLPSEDYPWPKKKKD